MLHRKILMASAGRTGSDDVIRMSKPEDFAAGPFRAVGKRELKGERAFPCVIDVAHGRTLYVLGIDAQKLREAPFANVYARQAAVSVLSVPWEAGPINDPLPQSAPLYLFSPGRCGSTLLHNILVAANLGGVSEPDIAAALISPAYQKYALLRPILRSATRIYARDLVSALARDGEPFVVKLRSQFCRAAPALLEGSRERRTIFLTRRFESWARSVGQLFKVSPAYLVKEYRQSLLCYSYLSRNSVCHFLRFEDFLEQPHEEMARLSEFLGWEISRDVVDKAMAVGSQSGTRLERASEQGVARWNAMKDDVQRLWTSSGSDVFCEEILRGAYTASGQRC